MFIKKFHVLLCWQTTQFADMFPCFYIFSAFWKSNKKERRLYSPSGFMLTGLLLTNTLYDALCWHFLASWKSKIRPFSGGSDFFPEQKNSSVIQYFSIQENNTLQNFSIQDNFIQLEIVKIQLSSWTTLNLVVAWK